MAKISNRQSSDDEQKVISELQRNGKEHIEEISKNCGCSQQKVRRIIRQLEGNGKIWGYPAIVDNKEQNLQKFMLFIKRSNKRFTEKEIDEIVTTSLDDMKEEIGISIISSYFLQGEYDLVTTFTAKDILQAKRFSNFLMEKFPGMQRLQLAQILFTVREQYVKNPEVMELKKFL